MSDPSVTAILQALRSRDAGDAWVEFLESYGPVLYQAARAYAANQDAATDCYVYICEQLAENRFRRLLKFNSNGQATFTTWLRVVARNLCFDWHRKQSGRQRPFKSLQDLSPLELEIYNWRFVRGASTNEMLERIVSMFPAVRPDELSAVEERLQSYLSSRQQWLLSRRRQPEANTALAIDTEEDGAALEVADPRPDQESQLATKQQLEQLRKGLTSLPADERLLIQLRFEQELTIDEVARLCGLGDGQRVLRKLAIILKKLRSMMR